MYNVGLTLFYQDVVRLPLDCHSHEVRQETRLDWGRQVACLVKLQVVDSVWLDHCPTSHCTYSIRTAAADRRKLHLLHLKTHSARVLWEQVVISDIRCFFIIYLCPVVIVLHVFPTLQCFDAVGWRTGRASGLLEELLTNSKGTRFILGGLA